jgi:hypothetical protein
MDPLTRRLALLAAKKTASPSVRIDPAFGTRHAGQRAAVRSALVLGLTGGLLGGCALSHAAPLASVTDAGTRGAPDVASATPDAGPDVMVHPPDAGSDAPLTCESLLASLEITPPGEGQTFSETARLDPSVGACCHQWEIDVSEGRVAGEGWPPSALAMACCDVVVFAQHLETSSILGCTPWGPPCPPEMPGLHLDA